MSSLRVEEESVPSYISMRSGGDANPNFQEEMEIRQKRCENNHLRVQGLQPSTDHPRVRDLV